MDEAGRKQQLCRLVRKRFPFLVVLRHEDLRTAGIPDISISKGRATLWIEAKYGPDAEATKLQREMLRKLDGFLVRYDVMQARIIDKNVIVTVIENAFGEVVHRGNLHEPVIEVVQSRLL